MNFCLKSVLFFTIILFVACKHKSHQASASISVHKKKIDVDDTCSNTDTLYKTDHILLIGCKSEPTEYAISYVSLKFKPYIYFSDFEVGVTNRQVKAQIKRSSNPLAQEYRTRISEAYIHDGINFGGHYCFAYWGCGSDCQASALVDLNTGVVYTGPDADGGYEFKKNTRMLIVNPPHYNGFYHDLPYDEPQIFIWNEKHKKFVQRNPSFE